MAKLDEKAPEKPAGEPAPGSSAQTLDPTGEPGHASASAATSASPEAHGGDDGLASAFQGNVPEQIGSYRITRLIGQGGMGAVYEAQQQQPRRKVALKVIRAGLLSRSMLRRFTFEVELLGRLQHPGIARIYEAGTAETAAGLQPYFAMEFVAGRPLARHAADLDVKAKLELMARVADAVHFAHQNGVIHRDLKPDNILVDEQGQPKVLDFGVARSTDADVQMTVETQPGAVVGTLAYMSPEQASGESRYVDVRADVYALGVIAYQVLSGRLPYELSRQSLVSALQVIRESEPVPLGATHKELRGDIESMLTKALEKDKNRRYQSAHDFAADIRRYLNNEPITARPADTMYHLRKFIWRNRVLAGGVAATFLVLLAGLGGTTWQWSQAVNHRQQAEENERAAQVRLGVSLVHEGDALARAGQWAEAKDRHLRGLETAAALGESVLPAQFGFWEDRYHSPEALTVMRSPGDARAIAFSPDGRRAVSGGGTIRLWDVGRGTVSHQIISEDQSAGTAVAFWGGGEKVVVGSGWGSVGLWNLEAGVYDWSEPVHGAPVLGVAAVGGGDDGEQRIVSVALDHSIAVFSAEGELLSRFGPPRPTEIFNPAQEGSAAVSPDGRLVAVGDVQGMLAIWNVADGAQIASFRAHEGTIHAMSFSADGRTIITGSADKTIRLWSADGQPAGAFEGHDNGVASVAISADGRSLLSGSWDQTVRLWDVAAGTLVRTFTGHTGPPRGVAFSPDGLLALSSSEDGTMRSWSLRPERQIRILAPDLPSESAALPYVHAVSVSPDGRLIATASADGALRLWDVATGLLLRSFHGHDGGATAVAFMPDGQGLLSGGAEDGMLRLWPVYAGDSAEPLLSISTPPRRVSCLAIAPDGKAAISGGPDGYVRAWDLGNGRQLHEHNPGMQEVLDLHYSQDPGLAVITYVNSAPSALLELWNPQTGAQVQILSRAASFQDVYCAAFDPAGKTVIAGGWSGVPRLWSAAAPYPPPAPLEGRGHGSTMMSVTISADGRYVITGGWDNSMQVWDMQRRSLIRPLMGHERPVVSVAASPDSRMAVSGSWDGTVRIWEFASVIEFFDQREAVAQAIERLQKNPEDGASLLALGHWYARRGADGLAVEVLSQAAAGGERVSRLLLARCYVSLQRWDEARRAYEQARATSEAPAPYVEMCLSALPPDKP